MNRGKSAVRSQPALIELAEMLVPDMNVCQLARPCIPCKAG
jgi:hypothetical protein